MTKLIVFSVACLATPALATNSVVIEKGETLSEILYRRKLEVGATTPLYGSKGLVEQAKVINPRVTPTKKILPGTVVQLPPSLIVKDEVPEPSPSLADPLPPIEVIGPGESQGKWSLTASYSPAYLYSKEETPDGATTASVFNFLGGGVKGEWQLEKHIFSSEVRAWYPGVVSDLDTFIDVNFKYSFSLLQDLSIGAFLQHSDWSGFTVDRERLDAGESTQYLPRPMQAQFLGVSACYKRICAEYAQSLSAEIESLAKTREVSSDGKAYFYNVSYSQPLTEKLSLVPMYEKRIMSDDDEVIEQKVEQFIISLSFKLF